MADVNQLKNNLEIYNAGPFGGQHEANNQCKYASITNTCLGHVKIWSSFFMRRNLIKDIWGISVEIFSNAFFMSTDSIHSK